MQKAQLRFQKITLIGCIVLAAVMIFFALGFSTNFHQLRQHRNPAETMFFVEGAEFYDYTQPFNRLLFNHCIALFVVCVAMFVTLTHRRRLYYFSNYITSVAFGAYAIYVGRLVLTYALHFRELYLQVDFERMLEIRTRLRMDYSVSTFMMDAGIVLSVLLFIAAGMLFVNLIMKTVWMRQEKWLESSSASSSSSKAEVAR